MSVAFSCDMTDTAIYYCGSKPTGSDLGGVPPANVLVEHVAVLCVLRVHSRRGRGVKKERRETEQEIHGGGERISWRKRETREREIKMINMEQEECKEMGEKEV